MSTPRVSVIGNGRLESTPAGEALRKTAESLGNLLASNGIHLVCGGLGGVMEAACKGARENGGTTIGILPSYDVSSANQWVAVPIATGLGQMRNMLVVANGDIVVALGGGYGTLSEVALAKKSGKDVIAIGKMGDVDGVVAVETPQEAMHHIVNFFKRS